MESSHPADAKPMAAREQRAQPARPFGGPRARLGTGPRPSVARPIRDVADKACGALCDASTARKSAGAYAAIVYERPENQALCDRRSTSNRNR